MRLPRDILATIVGAAVQEGGDRTRLGIACSSAGLRDIARVDRTRTVQNLQWVAPLERERADLRESGDVDTTCRPNARIWGRDLARHVRITGQIQRGIDDRTERTELAVTEYIRDNGRVPGVGIRSIARKYALSQPELRAAIDERQRPDSSSDYSSDP